MIIKVCPLLRKRMVIHEFFKTIFLPMHVYNPRSGCSMSLILKAPLLLILYLRDFLMSMLSFFQIIFDLKEDNGLLNENHFVFLIVLVNNNKSG